METRTPSDLSPVEFRVLRTMVDTRRGIPASSILYRAGTRPAASRLRAAERDSALDRLLALRLVEFGSARANIGGGLFTYRLTKKGREFLAGSEPSE